MKKVIFFIACFVLVILYLYVNKNNNRPVYEFEVKYIESNLQIDGDISNYDSLRDKLTDGEINENFISPEAAILDKIQYENDVIFVIAGTNKPKNSKIRKIGSPADSINSLVVNSVGFDNKPADYSTEGLVLSFFNKPDVCYYGGDNNKGIRTCAPLGEAFVSGTSFAAPWISRKLAYLIEILGLTRELAKALIIDSAAGWKDNLYRSQLIGYGVVPIHINDIVKVPDDEIKFMISGVSEKFDTFN